MRTSRALVCVGFMIVAWCLVGASSCDTTGGSSSSDSGSSSSASTPAGDPHALTVSNLTASIQANGESNSNFDNLKVSLQGTTVVVVAKPSSSLDEQYTITQEAEDTLSVIKAIKGWYTTVTAIHVQLDGDFTDAQGNTKSEPAAWIEMTDSTLNGINPDGLTTRAFETPSIVFSDGDAYYIHPAIWKNIKSADQDTLNGNSSSGNAIVSPLPN